MCTFGLSGCRVRAPAARHLVIVGFISRSSLFFFSLISCCHSFICTDHLRRQPFWIQPCWLKNFRFERCLCARRVHLFFVVLLPHETSHYASQGMDLLSNAFWLVRCDSGASSKVRSVAKGFSAQAGTCPGSAATSEAGSVLSRIASVVKTQRKDPRWPSRRCQASRLLLPRLQQQDPPKVQSSRCAQDRLLQEQLSQNEAFIERTRRRIAAIDDPKAQEVAQDSWFSLFCILVRRRSMPRRGWSAITTPSGWHKVICGPSTVASRFEGEGQGQREAAFTRRFSTSEESAVEGGPSRSCIAGFGEPSRWRRKMFRSQLHPQQRTAEASTRVARLKAALQMLGEDDPDAEPLKVARRRGFRLKCAQWRSVSISVSRMSLE